MKRLGWWWEVQGLSLSGVTAWPSQGDDEDRDVIPRTKLVVGETPTTVTGCAPGPQDQSLGQSGVPARSTRAHSCTSTSTGRWVHRPSYGSPSIAPLCPFLPHRHPLATTQPLPAGVIGLIGRQHPVHSGSYLAVTGDIPQPICPQDQHVIWAVLILRQVIHSHLVGKEGAEGAWG